MRSLDLVYSDHIQPGVLKAKHLRIGPMTRGRSAGLLSERKYLHLFCQSRDIGAILSIQCLIVYADFD